MKKNGFTLIELFAVIVVLSIVSLIGFNIVSDYIKESKNQAYNLQIDTLQKEAKKWALANEDKLDKYHLNNTYITFRVLKNEGYISNDFILNPKNREKMIGCMEISYDNSKKEYVANYIDYEYEKPNVEANSSEEKKEYGALENKACSGKNGIIYSYDDTGTLTKEENNVKTLATNKIVDNNDIKVIGNDIDGLYDIGDEYIFRGLNPNNYVTFANKQWRIVSINKLTNEIKLIRNFSDNSYSNNSKIIYNESTAYTETLSKFYDELSDDLKKKVNENATWKVGSIDSISSYDILKSLEINETIYAKVGLLSVADYMIASSNYDCYSSGNSCNANNYINELANNKTVWTINKNGENIWTISNGIFNSVNTLDTPYSLFGEIILNTNVYITEGNGSNISPYVIE